MKAGKSILVVGGGGREHAIAHTLSKSALISKIYVAPGNGGTQASKDGKIENIKISVEDVTGLVSFAKTNKVAMTVVGPEQPLVLGVVDAMIAMRIPCFGPSKNAATIEASKAWSKEFMQRNSIPTARFKTFDSTNMDGLEMYLRSLDYPVVVKASGLCAGKGVVLPDTIEEAVECARAMLSGDAFGEAGREVVVEERLVGEEVSVLAFCDGLTSVCMPPAQDHKRALDHDEGPNTGGMGAYAPAPALTPLLQAQCAKIVQDSVSALAKEGRPFHGVLYAGFMLTAAGPMVLEYNCRFGDPETQALLPLLESDLFTIMRACCDFGGLEEDMVRFSPHLASCTVVLASGGYPGAFETGKTISGIETASTLPGSLVFHAGTRREGEDEGEGRLVTSGGRVLAVTGVGPSIRSARDVAYKTVSLIDFERKHYRTDIANRALSRPIRVGVLGSTRGSSLEPVFQAVASGSILANIALVASNKADSGILDRAAKYGHPTLHIPAKGLEREEFDAKVTAAFEAAGVELVLLVGYMRILSATFVSHWHGRCINVHPSLLPDFAGGMDLSVHDAVIKAGRTESGCTVHQVTEEVDAGPVLVQLRCPVEPGDSPESLKARVQALEGPALIEAIELIRSRHNVTATSLTYKAAGVDIDAGEALVEAIKPMCKSTRRAGCDAALGGFGGLFDLAAAGLGGDDTVLVSGADGVGTKLKIAQAVGKHDTIGIDLVAMNVNDILVCGAEPLFFLDYYATGALRVGEAAAVVSGIAEGCRQAGAALIGGETAEMAGMYAPGEYDLAGFAVGAVKRNLILPRGIAAGDVLIGLRSSGVHSNGYSLVRKCVEKSKLTWTDESPFQPGTQLGDALLCPTKIYVKALLPLIGRGLIKGMAHITGGGLLDNLPRVLPQDVIAVVDVKSSGWELPPVFRWLQSLANLPQKELLRTFNCGIGMVVVVAQEHVEEVLSSIQSAGESTYLLGRIQKREFEKEQVVVVGDVV